MHRNCLAAALLITPIVCACHSSGSETVFRQLESTRQHTGLRPAVVNPIQVDPSDFPATFNTWSGAFCSASLVGPTVLLTAGHCVPMDAVTKVKVETSSGNFYGTCIGAPDPTDLALCSLNGEPRGVTYETVNARDDLLHEQQSILLSGFGCTQSNGGGPDMFGVGLTTISSLPTAANPVITTRGNSTLCSGDSGAPAFLLESAATQSPQAPGALSHRLVVAVATTGIGLIQFNATAHSNDDLPPSTLTSTSSQAAQDFFGKWMRNTGLKICGLSAGVPRCRAAPAK